MKNILLFLLVICFSSCSGSENDKLVPDPPMDNSKPIEAYLTVRNSTPRLTKQESLAFTSDVSQLTIRLDTTDIKQEMEGFGAALTGSSAYLIRNMSANARATLLNDLFADEGIALKYLRLCIGSSDFSLGDYTYCDKEGIENFAVPETDKRDLLPILKEIKNINKNIRLMATPWTAPAWMKENKQLYGGSLTGESVYNDFAEYFVKYINTYKVEGIGIDAISLQNEPHHTIATYPTMYMEWSEQSKIIRDYLGPKFKEAGINTKILIWDHNFDEIDYPISVLNDAVTRQYVSGVAFHGYGGKPSDIDRLLNSFPETPIYFTEQSGGGWNTDDPIGNMLYYMKEMLMPTINKGAKNFLMWNLALNPNHGPVTTTGGGCQDCRGVVTIDGDKYSVNEEYYLLGHFSKFVKHGAHRIAYSITGTKPNNMEISTFLNTDGSKVVVVLNQSGNRQEFTIRTGNRRFGYSLIDQSVVTFVYK